MKLCKNFYETCTKNYPGRIPLRYALLILAYIVGSYNLIQLYKNIDTVTDKVIVKINNVKILPWCTTNNSQLVGQMYIDQTIPNMNEVEATMAAESGGSIEKGGKWEPFLCKCRVKVAVIIPYRKRENHLKLFLRHMHPILTRQLLSYRIFVVEQLENDPFNRAALFNAGFKEALKFDNYTCFVFSDVDLLPENDRNYYGCPTSPRHLAVGIDKFDFRLPYYGYLGGVASLVKEHYLKINGMSNAYWGWGGEDDDLNHRIAAAGLNLTRPSISISRYKMTKLDHFRSSPPNPKRFKLLKTSKKRMFVEGLNTVRYKLSGIEEKPLVTFIRIVVKKSMYVN